jgi:polyhydroxyalkanoate synthesis regulator phasin
MSSKKKVIAIAITSVALTASSFGVANAAPKAKVTRTTVTTVANKAVGAQGRGQELATLLSGLVAKGTITQAQADAIIAAVTAAEAARDAARPQGPKDGGKGGFDQKLALISTTLGIDSPTVLSRLKAGESLATIAGTKKAVLITALVADETKRIDAAVTAGKLTADQATTLKANLVAHVTAEVEATAPLGGKMGDKGPKGPHGEKGGKGPKMGGAAPTIPAPSTTTSSNQ